MVGSHSWLDHLTQESVLCLDPHHHTTLETTPMPSPIALVPKATADDDTKDSCVRLLRHALEQAESGQLTTVILIVEHVDGDWLNHVSETSNFSKAIGRLEITKAEWVAQYLAAPTQSKS